MINYSSKNIRYSFKIANDIMCIEYCNSLNKILCLRSNKSTGNSLKNTFMTKKYSKNGMKYF